MSTLVVMEHKEGRLAGASLNTIVAATELGKPVTALVAAGEGGAGEAAQAASRLKGVSNVSAASARFLVTIHACACKYAWCCCVPPLHARMHAPVAAEIPFYACD